MTLAARRLNWLATFWFSVLGIPLGALALEPTTSNYGKVELLRDAWGIPHVFADSDEGAMFGLGQAVAEDRGFQMMYNLRTIQGRLAEIIGDRPSQRAGETAMAQDARMRTFGFFRAARALAAKLDARSLSLLQAYSDGVNAWFAKHQEDRHPLFAKLGFAPEAWTPTDCIASMWHLGQFFAGDGTSELADYRDFMKGVNAISPANLIVDDAAAVVGRADVSDKWLDRVERFHQDHTGAAVPVRGAAPEGPKFSHAWVVGGTKTNSGAAVLVSDPQTPVLNPSLWYEFHVCGKNFNARGVSVPGSPGIMIGWTENFAWGVTALGADQADLFRLKTDTAHPNQYSFDGQWREMEIIRETIRVRGGKAVELAIRQTHFGPVVTAYADPVEGDPEVALKRVPQCLTESETIQGLLGMMQAQEIDDFTRALALWHFPSVNLIFGDRRGNIGYWLQAAIPVRSTLDAQQGLVAVDGSDSRYDWRGFVPHELLPHVINPRRGWIASGNHRAVGSFYPIRLGNGKGSNGHTLRSWRLYERLMAQDVFTSSDVLDIHFDTVNPARRDVVRAGLLVRDQLGQKLSANADSALRHLETWYELGAKSDLTIAGTALAGQIETEFRAHTTPLASKYGGGNGGLVKFLSDLRSRLDSKSLAQLSHDEIEFIDRALASACGAAQKVYGSDPATWDRQARDAVEQQARGYFNGLNGFGSLDPAGDLKTPTLTCVDVSTIKSQGSQSYTQYVPLDNVDAAQSILPPGESERIDIPWRTSTWNLWQQGKLHPAPLSRNGVQKIATQTTILGN